MADLQEDDDHHHLHLHDVPILISPQNNHLPHHLHEFDVFPLDLDLSSSQHFLHRRINRIAPPISSLDRQNHLNFVSDMFHQRVEQSQSQSQSQPHSASSNIDSDRSFRVIEENDDIISNQFEADFGPGLGLGLGFLIGNSDNPNFDDDNHSGFIVADSVDSSQLSGLSDGDCDEEEASFQLCWDSFHLEDEIPNPNSNSNSNSNANSNSNSNSNANANANGHEDFEWEEVDDDAPVLLTAFEVEQPTEQPEPEHGPEALEWQVLSNVNSFEPSPDSEDDESEDYNYTEYEMLFGQFADGDASLSGRPPASRTVVVSLSTVVVSEEDVVKNNAVCAVCKDEVVVGELMTQLPCGHRYHGGCILPWLAVRNTCPVCRHELPTDDPDYERRKAERG